MPVSWLPRPARSYLHNRIFLSRYKVAAFLRRRPGKSQYSWYFLRGRDLIFRNSVTGANPEIFSKNFYLNSVMKFCHGRHENARELFKRTLFRIERYVGAVAAVGWFVGATVTVWIRVCASGVSGHDAAARAKTECDS